MTYFTDVKTFAWTLTETLPTRLTYYLSVCVSARLPVCLRVYLSVCLTACLSVCHITSYNESDIQLPKEIVSIATAANVMSAGCR